MAGATSLVGQLREVPVYGIVNLAIEDLIISEHGRGAWKEICSDEDTKHVFTFVTAEKYPDQITYSLISSASRLLGLSQDEVLRNIGRHWVTFIEKHSYGNLLRFAGKNFSDIIGRIDQIHAQALAIMPDLKAPTIQVEQLERGEFLIHYRSMRPGLAWMAIGVIEGIADKFRKTLEIQHRERSCDGADHDLFSVRIIETHEAGHRTPDECSIA